MRCALLAAAVALPATALAALPAGERQVIDPDNYNPTSLTSYVNAAACATNGVAKLEWYIPTATTGTGSNYQLFATNANPAERASPDTNFCFEAPDSNKSVAAGLVTSVSVPDTLRGTVDVAGSKIVTPAGKTCDAASENLIVYVCAHWYVDSTRRDFANGKFIIQVKPAPKPTGLVVKSGDGRLIVSWTPGTATSSEASSDHYLVTATGPTAGDTHTTSVASGGTATATVSGLVNGTTYTVTVEAFSVGGNGSGPSAEEIGTPLHVADFWEYYKNAGGREAGGCASGPAGALAILGALSLLAARRRK